MSTQTGAAKTGATFCWHCNRQLRRAPGKGLGLFYFGLVAGQDGVPRRVHDDCIKHAVADGARSL